MEYRNHHQLSMGSLVVKVLLVVIVAGAIFGVGVCAGIRAAVWRGLTTPRMANTVMPAPMAKVGMMGKWDKDEVWGRKDSSLTRVFGTVTKVEGNQITVLNNAAASEMVLSLASTVITASSTEVSLSALKTGQNITAIGSMNTNNVLEARFIQIQ